MTTLTQKMVLNGGIKFVLQLLVVVFACGVLYQKVSAMEKAVNKIEVRLHAVENLLMRRYAPVPIISSGTD